MTLSDFTASLQRSTPPELSSALLALWLDAKGDWQAAHNIAQDIRSADGSWIHAYLHRKEGDSGNASYWYRRAGKPFPSETLEEEWRTIAKALLAGAG